MKRAIACALAVAAVGGCGNVRPSGPRDETTATIHNAIDFGLGSSIYFAVSRIDGAVVHRKFDRDSLVRVAPGRHDVRIRYYFEGLSGAAAGEAECRVELEARAGADYYLEGAADDGRWRARLVDAEGATEWPCSFPDGSGAGAVAGSARTHALSARPRTSAAQAAPPAVPTGAGDVPVAERARMRDVDAGTPTPVDALSPAAVAAAPSGEAGDGAEVVAGPTAPAGAAAPPTTRAAGTWSGGAVGKVLHGRGHWGCPANLFRVSAIEAETIALGGNERIRLLGVEPLDQGRFVRALEPLVDRCVSLEFDEALAGKILRDRDGSLRAYVIDESGELVNAAVIRRGGATVDPRTRCRRRGELMAAQSEANAASRNSAGR
jgi:hypothetical protein